jgi:hypothetical protein
MPTHIFVQILTYTFPKILNRYMAPELLDSSDRYPPADVFSLGLALYESCIFNDHSEIISDGLSALPSEGPDWHVLRHGEVRYVYKYIQSYVYTYRCICVYTYTNICLPYLPKALTGMCYDMER